MAGSLPQPLDRNLDFLLHGAFWGVGEVGNNVLLTVLVSAFF